MAESADTTGSPGNIGTGIVSEDNDSFSYRDPDGTVHENIPKNIAGGGLYNQLKAMESGTGTGDGIPAQPQPMPMMQDPTQIPAPDVSAFGAAPWDVTAPGHGIMPVTPANLPTPQGPGSQDMAATMPAPQFSNPIGPGFQDVGTSDRGNAAQPQQGNQRNIGGGAGVMVLPSQSTGTQDFHSTNPIARRALTAEDQAAQDYGHWAPIAMRMENEKNIKAAGMNAEVNKMMMDASQRKYDEDVQDWMDRRNKLDTLINDRSQMHLDPNRIFGDSQTGNKIWATLSLALGSIGGALSGKDYNTSIMGAINTAINRDIDAQKTEMESADKVIGQKRGMLDDAMAISKSERAAREAVYMAHMSYVKNAIDAMANSPRYANPENQKVLAQTKGVIENTLTKSGAGLDNITHSDTFSKAAKPFDPSDNNFKDLVRKHQQTLEDIQTVRELVQHRHGVGVDTGYMNQNFRDYVEGRFGFLSPDEATFMTKSEGLVASKIEAIAKARGFAPGEKGGISKLAPNAKQNPAAYLRQLDDLEKQENLDLRTAYDQEIGQYHNTGIPYENLGRQAQSPVQFTPAVKGK